MLMVTFDSIIWIEIEPINQYVIWWRGLLTAHVLCTFWRHVHARLLWYNINECICNLIQIMKDNIFSQHYSKTTGIFRVHKQSLNLWTKTFTHKAFLCFVRSHTLTKHDNFAENLFCNFNSNDKTKKYSVEREKYVFWRKKRRFWIWQSKAHTNKITIGKEKNNIDINSLLEKIYLCFFFCCKKN